MAEPGLDVGGSDCDRTNGFEAGVYVVTRWVDDDLGLLLAFCRSKLAVTGFLHKSNGVFPWWLKKSTSAPWRTKYRAMADAVFSSLSPPDGKLSTKDCKSPARPVPSIAWRITAK